MNKSFTLIEILVVIVVIGVLSAFILVGMSSITRSANIAKSQAFINSIDNSLLLARISQWKFDESSGATAYDSWGLNNGTLSDALGGACAVGGSCPQWVNSGCVSQNCLSFDGTGDYVGCGNGSSFSLIINSVSVGTWVKVSSISESKYIITKYMGGTGGTGWLLYVSSSGGKVGLDGRDGSAYRTSGLSVKNIVDNNWHYLVGVVNNNLWEIWIDGIKENSSDSGYYNTELRSTANLVIGNYSVYYGGLIDDVRIYNQAIPTSQINQNYFVGINKLFKDNGIALDEFNQRLVELRNN